MLGATCDAFCTAYPLLCKDPTGTTLRGNFAAPNGDYYTQVGDPERQSFSGVVFTDSAIVLVLVARSPR